jgi:hypothetical protein
MLIDPSGQIGFIAVVFIAAAVGGVVSGISQIISNKMTGKDPMDGIWGAVDDTLSMIPGVGAFTVAFASASAEILVNTIDDALTGELQKHTAEENITKIGEDLVWNVTGDLLLGKLTKPLNEGVQKISKNIILTKYTKILDIDIWNPNKKMFLAQIPIKRLCIFP